jgi:hypothetical protein
VTWVDGFRFFVKKLVGVFGRAGARAENGLVAALVCAVHPQAKEYFGQLGLAGVLEGLEVDAGHQRHKEQLMKYLISAEDRMSNGDQSVLNILNDFTTLHRKVTFPL